MNYQIINNSKALIEFIEFLPELNSNECYYVSLLARNKYFKIEGLRGDKQQLKRFVSKKYNLYEKIEKLEVRLGSYKVKGLEIPQEALVLYITINPRNESKALLKIIKDSAELLYSRNENVNVLQIALTAIHKSKGKTRYIDFDFDNVEIEDLKPTIYDIINPEACVFIQTRGGFHLLVNVNKVDKKYVKTYYKSLSTLGSVDIKGDNLIPVPGCCQSRFTPKIIV
jgi:DNA gyrase/topoisomerase IV subunit A